MAHSVLTHPERILWPGTAYSKQSLADYCIAVAPWLLPGLAERPLSILRCPDGIGAECFFQKHHTAGLGAHVASLMLREKSGARASYLCVRDLDGVLDLVQMNTLEFHVWGARVDDVEHPDRLVFDLDPAPGVPWREVIAVAREVRDRLRAAGLASFARLTGGKGVHVVAPIVRGPDWTTVKAFCRAVAEAMAADAPERCVATAAKAKRSGRIFIDWLRNARGATAIASWSPRARAGAPVAMPLRWDELGRTRGGNDYDLAAALRRARTLRSDPWQGFADLQQSLPAAPH